MFRLYKVVLVKPMLTSSNMVPRKKFLVNAPLFIITCSLINLDYLKPKKMSSPNYIFKKNICKCVIRSLGPKKNFKSPVSPD